ncbi:MAG: tail fiber domain-containing protein, partial [Bacteroidia bacterium]|nr:tail fiber domain-containing protein [Bacteroidia bacterium]
SQNIAIGYLALALQSFNNSGTAWNTENVAIGSRALTSNQPTSSTNGYRNTAVGSLALQSNSTGSLNTAIGYNANVGSGALSNATAIGANAQVDIANAVVIGSINGINGAAATANVGIGTTAPQSLLHIGSLSTSAVVSTNYSFTMQHYDPTFAAANQIRPYMNRAWNGSLGDFLYISASGNRDNNQQAAIIFSELQGILFGRGSNTASSLFSEHMKLSADGRLGIGTTAPLNRIHVTTSETGGAFVARFDNSAATNTSNGVLVTAGSNSTAGALLMRFNRPDGMQIGSISQASATTVNYNITSDERLKNVVSASTYGLKALNQIKVVDYYYKSDESKTLQNGFLAQQLFQHYPFAVTQPRDEKSFWQVDYGKLTPILVKSVQELNQKLEIENQKLRSENEQLKAQILQLSNDNKAIKADLEEIKKHLGLDLEAKK